MNELVRSSIRHHTRSNTCQQGNNTETAKQLIFEVTLTYLNSLLRNAGTFCTSPFSSKLKPDLLTPGAPSLSPASDVGERSSCLGEAGSLLGPATALRLVVMLHLTRGWGRKGVDKGKLRQASLVTITLRQLRAWRAPDSERLMRV